MDAWDVPLNANFGLLDTILGGSVTVPAVSGANVILNATQLAFGTIVVTGAIPGNCLIGFPAVSGWWSIFNQTTGGNLFISPAGSVENITVPPGQITDIQIIGIRAKFRSLPFIGSYLDYAGAAVPPWVSSCTIPPYLLCDGSAFSGTTYPYLAAILGGTNVPDFRGRAPYYLNGGSGHLTSGGAGIDGNTLFATGGANGITLATNQIPTITSSNAAQAIFVASAANVGQGGTINTVGTPGSGTAVAFISGPGLTNVPLGSSANNNISVTYTNGAQQVIGNAAPGLVSGIRMIRAG